MSVGSSGGDGETTGVPPLSLGNNSQLDETLALSIGLVAKSTVDAVVQDAVEALAQAVAGATQWFVDAAREELISQAVIAAEPPDIDPVEEEEEDKHATSSPADLVKPLPLLNRPSSAVIHAVAKATVDAATQEAVVEVARAVEKATEWITQAVENELVSETMDPDEGIAIHNATEWITQAVRSELVAHAVADASPPIDTAIEEPEEPADAPEIVPAHSTPRLSFQDEIPLAAIRELAKATAEEAVGIAVENVAQAFGLASTWLAQAVRGELVAQAVTDASSPDPDGTLQVDEADTNSADATALREQPQQHPPPSTEEVEAPVNVPALQLPSATPVSSAAVAELAVPFVNEVVASALHQAVPVSPPEPQDEEEVYDDDSTPINTPTAEDAPSRSPLRSTRAPEPETPFVPPVILSGRATPPDKATPRRKSPITSKRGLGTPPSTDNSPSSAPPAVTSGDDRSALCSEPEPPHSTLPPLVLPGIQGAPLSGRTKLHHHKTPRKTPRFDEAVFVSDSSRTPSKTSSRLENHTSKSSIAAELELTPRSSARAAALIYAQQPPSSRHHRHHHHKAKKLRDAASQTSPPPSPPLTTLPPQPLVAVHNDSHITELPKTQTPRLKHSPRDASSPENGAEKKTDGGNNSLLAPLTRTPAVPPSADASPPKSSSPSRTHRQHAHGHHKGAGAGGGGGGTSPNKRSGYCQRCVFEGRSCKINDCLKHQVLK